MIDDEPIGTITIEGRELPLLEIERFTAGDPPIECVDVRTPEGRRRFANVTLGHLAFNPDGSADAILARMEYRFP